MKKFNRHVTHGELKTRCEKEGFPFNDELYRTRGYDSVSFGFQYGQIFVSGLFDTTTGRAHGTYGTMTHQRWQFDTNSPELDNSTWFQKLLEFLYTDEPAPVPNGWTVIEGD